MARKATGWEGDWLGGWLAGRADGWEGYCWLGEWLSGCPGWPVTSNASGWLCGCLLVTNLGLDLTWPCCGVEQPLLYKVTAHREQAMNL